MHGDGPWSKLMNVDYRRFLYLGCLPILLRPTQPLPTVRLVGFILSRHNASNTSNSCPSFLVIPINTLHPVRNPGWRDAECQLTEGENRLSIRDVARRLAEAPPSKCRWNAHNFVNGEASARDQHCCDLSLGESWPSGTNTWLIAGIGVYAW